MGELGDQFMDDDDLEDWATIKDYGRDFFEKNGWEVLDKDSLPDIATDYIRGDTVSQSRFMIC